MRRSLALAFRPAVVRRGLFYGVFVGLILNLINHGSALLAGDLTLDRAIRIALTFCVPYLVSTASSVAALKGQGEGEKRS
ncbi:MAG: nitrate/nitrite transporter NrtS [Acidobacteriota bacterium]